MVKHTINFTNSEMSEEYHDHYRKFVDIMTIAIEVKSIDITPLTGSKQDFNTYLQSIKSIIFKVVSLLIVKPYCVVFFTGYQNKEDIEIFYKGCKKLYKAWGGNRKMVYNEETNQIELH